MGFTVHFNDAVSNSRLIHERIACSMGTSKDLAKLAPSEQEERSQDHQTTFLITDKFLDGIFLGIKGGSEEFIIRNTCWFCVVCRTSQKMASGSRSRSSLFQQHPWHTQEIVAR